MQAWEDLGFLELRDNFENLKMVARVTATADE
jgi:hypothetical protein